MKPNFALSLSFEGISLLHRTDRGWHLVGEVSPEATDMVAELQTLRKTAKALDNRGLRCRLIVPNDQVRYLAVETGKVDDSARIEGARIALDGATPYSVDELAISASAQGNVTHVAAVALETLQEAEAFATEHKFNPVCFVASPENGDYLGEPFFGLTNFAASLPDGGAGIAPEAKPVRISGVSELPPEPVQQTEPEPAPEQPVAEPTPSKSKLASAKSTSQPAQADSSTGTPAPQAAAPSFHSTRTLHEGMASDAPKLSGASRLTIAIPADHAPAPKTTVPDQADYAIPQSFVPTPQPPAQKSRAKHAASQALGKAASSLSSLGDLRGKIPSLPSMRPSAKAAPAPADSPAKASGETAIADVSSKATAGFESPDTQAVGGKPRYLGLVLTLVLLAFLAAVAAWASVFTDDGLAGLFRRDSTPAVIVTAPVDVAPVTEEVATAPTDTPAPDQITDSAEVEIQAEPPSQSMTATMSPREAEAHYVVTGIWLMAPAAPQPPAALNNESLYIASIDSLISAQDAVAIPQASLALTDQEPRSQSAPAAAGTSFAFDSRGLVVATVEGAVTPDGITIFKGRPAATPSKFPARPDTPPEIDQIAERLAKLRPRARPDDLLENAERARNGGLTRIELARKRPKARPATAKFELEKNQTATAQAVATSRKPLARPKNFTDIVEIARAQQQEQQGDITQVAAAAPAISAGPRIPTTASVARQATVKNAINLRKVNLIGVYGKPASRRALVRLANGRYKKVKIGDRIDGGKVSAIGETELRYLKSGRNVILKMPKI